MDMMGNKKPVFVCAALGGWYPAGLDRLERSLIFHGSGADFLFFRDVYPPGSPSHADNPYAFKIYALREAYRLGYRVCILLDSSFWAIRNPDPLFDIVNEHGVFAFRSGYNCANTCPDDLLLDVGITRDEAEFIPETATGIVGINFDNPDGIKVFEYWSDFCDRGLFRNSRTHNHLESADPRYLHGRQDQSAFSMALYKAGVSFLYEDYVAYYNNGKPGYNQDKCYFFIGGL